MTSFTTTFRAALFGAGLSLASGSAADNHAGAALDGEALANKYHCTTCHGPRGQSSDRRYPHIAGQNALYLQSRLEYFRAGTERGNQMNGQAAPLDDDAIVAIADWFSRQAR